MERSIIEMHKEMLDHIPEDKVELINSLNQFIYSIRNYSEDSLKSKLLYTRYLYKMLDHIPKRPLVNSDPTWMWNCQAVFSGMSI